MAGKLIPERIAIAYHALECVTDDQLKMGRWVCGTTACAGGWLMLSPEWDNILGDRNCSSEFPVIEEPDIANIDGEAFVFEGELAIYYFFGLLPDHVNAIYPEHTAYDTTEITKYIDAVYYVSSDSHSLYGVDPRWEVTPEMVQDKLAFLYFVSCFGAE